MGKAVVKDTQGAPASADRTRRYVLAEVATVVTFLILPAIVAAILVLASEDRQGRPQPSWKIDLLELAWPTFRDATLIIYIMATSGERWSSFGIVRPGVRDLAFFPVLLIASVLCRILGTVPFRHPPSFLPSHIHMSGNAILWSSTAYLLVAIRQELLFRSYLIPRIRTLTGSAWAAVSVSATLFAMISLPAGLPGIWSTFAMGLAYGAAMVLLGRVWPCILADTAFRTILALH